jgi:hypothetical protein
MSASLAVAFFVNGLALGVFFLPRYFQSFSKNIFADLMMKRCCYVIAIYLFMWNAAIMATLATGLSVNDELFRYMWFLGWVGWTSLIFIFVKTMFDMKSLYRKMLFDKRMGGQ